MNFFKELEAFFEWMGETETPISHSAALLWIYLLWRNNACALPNLQGQWLWRVQFYVRPELLERTLHTTYRNVARYRVELVNAGRLSYQNARRGRSPGQYTMVPFAPNVGPEALTDLTGRPATVYVVKDLPEADSPPVDNCP